MFYLPALLNPRTSSSVVTHQCSRLLLFCVCHHSKPHADMNVRVQFGASIYANRSARPPRPLLIGFD